MAKKAMRKGIFITFEGCEGCGKSTHARLVYDYLKRRRFNCVLTREPGGTALGEALRKVLLRPDGIEISSLAELFLFEAARSEIVGDVIRPALAKRSMVICDRFSDATLAYQGCGGGIEIGAIRALDVVATAGLKPDLTIVLDIDTATGLKRARKKGVDRMESKTAAYHRRVRRGYLALARQEPRRIKVIKVLDGIAVTQDLVRREVEIVIQRYKRPG